MDMAIVVGSTEIEGRQWWIVEAESSRRYHLRPDQFRGAPPRVGLLGKIGYVQGTSSMMQVFVA